MTKTYLCGVDYQHEMGEGLADFFNTIDELKAAKPCWKSCGIVELSLNEAGEEVGYSWVEQQSL